MKSAAIIHSYRLPSIISLFLAPFLMFVSTFYWKNGEYGVRGGTLVILASVFWIPAVAILFNMLSSKYPRYAAWGWLIATIGFVSGICFGFLGMVAEMFQITHQQYLSSFAQYPLDTNLVLFWPGPLAPLSLFVLGIQFFRSKVIPGWTSILICLGAIAFPLAESQELNGWHT
jgi:hypothetical protein